MVFRVYVQRKPAFDEATRSLARELTDIVGLKTLEGLAVARRYDVEGISAELFSRCVKGVFSEAPTDDVFYELDDLLAARAEGSCALRQNAPADDKTFIFAVEYLPGQFDQRADSAAECIQLISQGERPLVKSATLYIARGALSESDKEALTNYLVNPVEARLASLDKPESLSAYFEPAPDVEVLFGFTELGARQLEEFLHERGLAMDKDDLSFCQRYFREEGREPTITEIKMIDTYWSDHCRHTTFSTILDEVESDDPYVSAAFDDYKALRGELKRENKALCLMDIATIGARALEARGILRNRDISDEINACTVKCKVDVDGQMQDWLYLFKNETHNHPTEIEPFGGAATCIGGAIRDPLSGRAYVYQAMRVTGAADPRVPVADTLPGKLPQRKLTVTAAEGYSSYGNQIGLATGQVSEIYHPGYVAKRMEIGAVVAAAKASAVRRSTPAPGDVIVVLGGRTGRDGIGGATGSSKAHNKASLEHCGAEVQKGNAPTERKLQRLFRREEATRLIKRCNDFGAGGVSVAVGELADGVVINLDEVPRKYEGLDGTELAIAESQERMAIVLGPDDLDEFLAYAKEENLEATPIAKVTEEARVRMLWRGNTIVDISRDFLNSNGAPKHARVYVPAAEEYRCRWTVGSFAERMGLLVGDLNVASQKGLAERFDSTIGAATVFMPFGGKHQLTPSLAMVAKFPVRGNTTTVSAMAWGFNPYISECNQYAAAYVAVVESVAKLLACGFSRSQMYLTFQEYFERLRDEPRRWGKPFASLLGALSAQIDLGVGAIGGKDSMSGSFEDRDVPPTLVSFATAIGSLDNVCSPEFKNAGARLLLVAPVYKDALLPRADSLCAAMDFVEKLISFRMASAVSTPAYGGIAEALFKMCVGNGIGLVLNDALDEDALFAPAYGSFLVELAEGAFLPAQTHDFYVQEIGSTCAAYVFEACGQSLSLTDLQNEWEGALEGVFAYRSVPHDHEKETAAGKGAAADTDANVFASNDALSNDMPSHDALSNGAHPSCTPSNGARPSSSAQTLSFMKSHSGPTSPRAGCAKPRVVIPVFPGTNCEYDTEQAFVRAGALVHTFVINNLSPRAISESANELARIIGESQIVMIPGGFSGGDEPDGSAKFIAAFFRAPQVTEAVRELLFTRDGLMLGICNGFQALVKLGLVPYGDICDIDQNCPTLTFNTIGRHQSKLVRTRVASNLSPWLSRCKVGDVHTVAISHGEGRFVANEEVLRQLIAKGQIATQYVDESDCASMQLEWNPNGSVYAIEGITSVDGRILGKMGHSERSAQGLYKNVPGDKYQPLFEGGVSYFN